MYTVYCWHCGNPINFKYRIGQKNEATIVCKKCNYSGAIEDSDALDHGILIHWDSMELRNFKSDIFKENIALKVD